MLNKKTTGRFIPKPEILEEKYNKAKMVAKSSMGKVRSKKQKEVLILPKGTMQSLEIKAKIEHIIKPYEDYSEKTISEKHEFHLGALDIKKAQIVKQERIDRFNKKRGKSFPPSTDALKERLRKADADSIEAIKGLHNQNPPIKAKKK